MSQTWFNRLKLVLGGVLLLFAGFSVVVAFRGAPGEDDLKQVSGVVTKVRPTRDNVTFYLDHGPGHDYKQGQPHFQKIRNIKVGQKLILLIDQRIHLHWNQYEIWEFRMTDNYLVPFETMLQEVPGASQGFICSAIILGIMGIVVLHATEWGEQHEEKLAGVNFLRRLLGR